MIDINILKISFIGLLCRSRLQWFVIFILASLMTSLLSACSFGVQDSVGYQMPITTDQLTAHQVVVSQASFKGRDALRVELTSDVQEALLSGKARSNGPSFVRLPYQFADGSIEVDVAARINGTGDPDVRGFVGIAFHIDDQNETFEAVYLRMTNGSKNEPLPPAPRNQFAVQYISYPDRYWRKLRQEHPYQYEKAAPVAIEYWHRLRLEILGSHLNVFVDDEKVLSINDLRFPGRKGYIGLWVDDGTAGYFSHLEVKPQM